MNANYAGICRVGNLEADFQQVLHIQSFQKHQYFKFSKEKYP